MCERINKCLEITDLKDMLKKTNELYAEKIAYKIKIEKGKYITFTHGQARDMINALRNCTNEFRVKRKKNSSYWRKQI